MLDREFEELRTKHEAGRQWGEIPPEPTPFDHLSDMMAELMEDGNWVDILLFVKEDGTYDMKLVGLIYGTLLTMIAAFFFLVCSAFGDDDKDKRD